MWQNRPLDSAARAGEEPGAAGSPAAPEVPDRADGAEVRLPAEILRDELDYIRDRRRSHDPDAEGGLVPEAGTGNDLTGVALSGGGIRSATFNLGLLQALSRGGLFRHVDYLSTVSGGGFIGSALTAQMRRPDGEGTGPAAFPFPPEGQGGEADTVRYLRSHSDYLAPQGLTDYLRAFALLARGIALNLVLLLPVLLILSLIGTFFFIDDLMAAARREGRLEFQRAVATSSAGAPGPADAMLSQPLSVDAAEGLRFEGHDLWTDRSAVVAAARSPDEKHEQIAAAGHDGSLWLFHFQPVVAELRRESGRVLAGGEPLDRLAFSSDACRLIGRQAESRQRVSALVGVEKSDDAEYCSPTFARELEWEPDEAGGSEPGGAVETPAGSPAWDPGRFRLARTGWSLAWLLLIFIGLYPFAAILAGPLGRVVDVLARSARGAVRLRRARPRRGAAAPGVEAPAALPAEDRGMSASLRVAGSVMLAVPLFALLSRYVDPDPATGFSGAQQWLWPVLGFVLMGGWWLLSVVFLAPKLRRWRPRPAQPASAASARSRRIRAALLLLLPWAVLWGLRSWLLGEAGGFLTGLFVPREPVWREIPEWVTLFFWWLACLVLLRPLLVPPDADEELTAARLDERRRERHRKLAGGLYAAVNLLLWIYLAHAAFHPLPRDVTGFVVAALVAGFGLGGDALVSGLTSVGLLSFFAGAQFLLWKAFARLALGGGTGDRARAAADAAGPEGGPLPATSSIVWRERYEKAFSWALLIVAAIAFLELQPYLVHYFHELEQQGSAEWLYYVAAAWFLGIVLAGMFLQVLAGVGKRVVLACLGILGPLLPFLVYLNAVEALVYGERWFDLRWVLFGPVSPLAEGLRLLFFVLSGIVLAYLVGKLVDANATGMHGFYRDRLSQAYLVGIDRDGRLGPEDDLSLRQICREGSGAPYHLINASLNMQRESAGAQRWRSSDFFVFSREWCGGPLSGYCRTEQLEIVAPGVHLGSAMAVSGAAAAPNMGSQTSRFLVMLMTLLNVRLGLWLPTPRRVRRLERLGMIDTSETIGGRLRRWWLGLRNRPSGYYVVKEMISGLDASGPYVNLSDGGHLENTGAYELLRRRCRFIVIGEAESDPAMRFEALAALMRYASIDLGVEIEIDPQPLRLRADGTSQGHWAVGRILYPPVRPGEPRQKGWLLYVKASVSGDESEIIREYRARHPDFPQESTADQVFEEDQFEAYRRLGFHIGASLFAGRGDGAALTGPGDIESWLDGLAKPAAG